ncbi:MAG: pyridoxamine 5'-phosphate oxidase family protein [Candidatus Omnitrophota bacterium]
MKSILGDTLRRFLETKEFINIATCDFNNRPNVAPKFLIKIEGDSVYLADYVLGRTLKNLELNPLVSLSTVRIETLTGYQLNGTAKILSSGTEYEKIFQDMSKRQLDLSAKRIAEGVHSERQHKNFEVELPERVVVIKVKIEEVVCIGPGGQLERKRLRASH